MLNDPELRYFFLGFHRVLKRYRLTSFIGWSIVFMGCASVLLRWNLVRSTELLEISLTALSIFAGLVVVWQNISALEEYIKVPFPETHGVGEIGGHVISEIRDLMKEVHDGGWQEAYAALGKLKTIQSRYNLPRFD